MVGRRSRRPELIGVPDRPVPCGHRPGEDAVGAPNANGSTRRFMATRRPAAGQFIGP